jgi:succinyl-CoA synthetase beta subunit
MNIHEYQAKSVFREYGIPVPRGKVAESPEQARRAAEELGGNSLAVKAQIYAGGRGKGGGVKLVHSPEEAEKAARQILGMNLVTVQTGPSGRIVKKVLVEEALSVKEELYVSIVLDRAKCCPVVMASRSGGVDIERVAQESPEKIVKQWISPVIGFKSYHANRIGYGLGFDAGQVAKLRDVLLGLSRAFRGKDCLMAEINPLVLTEDGNFIALDAKMNVDDNALARHQEIEEMRDLNEEDPLETEASKYHLSYIRLNGHVGCMVNGAGLAMATMDVIKVMGEEPANFLDVGGGATTEMVKNGFKILVSDPQVKVVFINIFGGILRGDTLANGVTQALREVNIRIPVVVRLEGTNVEQGKQILKDSGFDFIITSEMQEAAEKVIEALKTVANKQ